MLSFPLSNSMLQYTHTVEEPEVVSELMKAKLNLMAEEAKFRVIRETLL